MFLCVILHARPRVFLIHQVGGIIYFELLINSDISKSQGGYW